MRVMLRSFLVAAVCLFTTEANAGQVDQDPGPEPSFAEVVKIGEAAVLDGFYDSSSARFQWDRGLSPGGYQPIFQHRIAGWATCGLVNGKNRFGGYVGFRRFIVVIRNDSVVYSRVSDGGDIDLVQITCDKAIRTGKIPLAPEQPASPEEAEQPSSGFAPLLGFSFDNVPEGLRVKSLTPGSIASSAGLQAAMIVEKVNGVKLAGLAPGLRQQLLEAADQGSTLSVAGLGDLKMERH